MLAKPIVAVFRSPLFNRSETFVRSHVTGLDRYQALLVGLHDLGNIPAALQAQAVLPISPLQTARIKLLGRSDLLAPRVRPLKPVLVHAHFGTDGLLALPLARQLGIPLATTLHGYDVHRPRTTMLRSGRLSWMRYALFQRRLINEGALFLTVSDAMRRKALAKGYPDARTVTHYNGIDLERFHPGGQPREEGLILHVGRLVEKKGTTLLVRAFANVKRACAAARLVIVGDGPLEGEVRRTIASLRLDGAVTLTGALDPDAMRGWMQKAWLLAVPSLTARDGDAEGLPTVIPEAAACGLPVVGSNHEGIPEAVVDGETGAIVPERDQAALTASLIALLQQTPGRHADMSGASRRLAESRFDARQLTARLEDHYDRLVQAAGQPCA